MPEPVPLPHFGIRVTVTFDIRCVSNILRSITTSTTIKEPFRYSLGPILVHCPRRGSTRHHPSIFNITLRLIARSSHVRRCHAVSSVPGQNSNFLAARLAACRHWQRGSHTNVGRHTKFPGQMQKVNRNLRLRLRTAPGIRDTAIIPTGILMALMRLDREGTVTTEGGDVLSRAERHEPQTCRCPKALTTLSKLVRVRCGTTPVRVRCAHP